MSEQPDPLEPLLPGDPSDWAEVDPNNPDSVIGEIGEDSDVPPGFPDRTVPGDVPDISDESAWGSVTGPPWQQN